MEGSFKMVKVVMVRNKKKGEKITKKGLNAINYVVYCNDGVECGSATTLKKAKQIMLVNKQADYEMGADKGDIYYYIEKEYEYSNEIVTEIDYKDRY